MPYRENTCTICGPRPHNLPQKLDLPRLEQRLEQEIQAAVELGYRTFLTGAAMGVDLWASEIVLRLREDNPALQLLCFQPCETQAEQWPLEWTTLYHSILQQCDAAHCLQHKYTDGCMQRRNRIMVEYSSRLIAVYDGRGEGGTAHTLRFAQTRKLEVSLVNPLEYCR